MQTKAMERETGYSFLNFIVLSGVILFVSAVALSTLGGSNLGLMAILPLGAMGRAEMTR